MRAGPSRWRLGRRGGRIATWIALLALAAGCSGGTDPVNRLKARLQLKEGNRSYLAGQYESAVRSYDMALHYVPQLAPACLHRAYSLEALSRASERLAERQRLAAEAVDSFEKYLDMIDHGAVGLDSRAPGRERIEERILTLLVASEQPDEAIRHLQARHAKDPRDTSALEMLSRLEIECGRLDEALRWQRKRVELAPQDADALYGLGTFVWLLTYRDAGLDSAKRAALLDEGLAALQRALEIRPDDYETLIYVNLLYREKAKHADGDRERNEFEVRAKTFRDRALAVRRMAADPAPSDRETSQATSEVSGCSRA
jgi:tetratricopeptide (TPR) repeat protein